MKIELTKLLDGGEGEFELNVNLEIRERSFLSLVGESGAGKTSLLRMLAGFMQPATGQISVNGNVWYSSSKSVNLNPQKRNVGFVFQDYALFPNMTIRENLEFALEKKQDRKMVDELLNIISIHDLQHRKPGSLSGGQKQRVALARALVRKPSLLLLDEPLSALDKKMRGSLQDYILSAHKKYGLTTIMVSHDAGEIFKMSDEVLFLQNGKILQRATPARFYSSQEVSGKFKFTGEIVSMEKSDVVYIVSIMIGSKLVKVVADQSEASEFKLGDEVLVASKAFNPVIQKVRAFK